MMTSDEDIDKFVNGSNFTRITGMIESTEGMKTYGKTLLFRFIVNNNSQRRIRLIAWDQDAVEFENKIKADMVCSFMRLRCKSVDEKYFKPAEGLVKKELHFTEYTKMEVKDNVQTVTKEIRLVTMEEIPELFGIARVQGFLTDRIVVASRRNAKFTFGSGAMTDGTHQIQINVLYVAENDVIYLAGTHIQVTGRLIRDRAFGLTALECSKMSDIQRLDDKVMTEEELAKSFTSPQKCETKDENKPKGPPQMES
ncbi:uncharacterized protein LOC141533488 [Cotesia typhae]|uniref:uncharacterized protein LOC141533488 n=1 Tax=Cotesia typhae TaxID=2053667 RepID=UPI003D685480